MARGGVMLPITELLLTRAAWAAAAAGGSVSQVYHPFNAGCLPLNGSGNPGVNGVHYEGSNALPPRRRGPAPASR